MLRTESYFVILNVVKESVCAKNALKKVIFSTYRFIHCVQNDKWYIPMKAGNAKAKILFEN